MNPLLEQISIERMADDLWRLVNVWSPTGNEREAAFLFAEMLADAGAEVEIDERLCNSPNVIGRLKGNRPGKTFQLAGHIDHIDVPHAPPARTRHGDLCSGRIRHEERSDRHPRDRPVAEIVRQRLSRRAFDDRLRSARGAGGSGPGAPQYDSRMVWLVMRRWCWRVSIRFVIKQSSRVRVSRSGISRSAARARFATS